MNFGDALKACKSGNRIARAGWNGKGMFVFLSHGSTTQIPDEDGRVEGIDETLFVQGHEGTSTRLPNLNMQAATGSTVVGWLASQTDLLAEDWQIL